MLVIDFVVVVGLVGKLCPILFVISWTAACQAPLSLGFPRQEYWSELPFPSPGDLPDPGIESTAPALADRFFTTEPRGKPNNRLLKIMSMIVIRRMKISGKLCIIRLGKIIAIAEEQ